MQARADGRLVPLVGAVRGRLAPVARVGAGGGARDRQDLVPRLVVVGEPVGVGEREGGRLLAPLEKRSGSLWSNSRVFFRMSVKRRAKFWAIP